MENNTLLSPYFPINNYNNYTSKKGVNKATNNLNNVSITFDSIKSYGFVVIPVSKKFKHMIIRTDLINVPIQIYNIRTSVVNTSIELLQHSSKWNTGNTYSTILSYLNNADFILAAYDTSNLHNITNIADGIPIGFASVSIKLKKISKTKYVKYLHINNIYINNTYKNSSPEIPLIKVVNFIALNNNLYKVTLNSPLIKVNSYKKLGFYKNTEPSGSNNVKLALKVLNTNYNTQKNTNNRNYTRKNNKN